MDQIMLYRAGMEMRIGDDSVVGVAPGMVPVPVVVAIGIDPIGNCVARDSATGRYVRFARARRVSAADYTTIEPVETCVSATPRRRRGVVRVATQVVLAVVAVAVAVEPSAAPWGIGIAAAGLAVLRAARWLSRYLDREFVADRQWVTTLATAPLVAAILSWIFWRVP